MESQKPKSERDRTDKSLKDERTTTDNYVEREMQRVEEDTTRSIHADRGAADKELLRARAAADRLAEPRLEEDALAQERGRSDYARVLERAGQDEALRQERVQTRLIIEALFEKERRETDLSLLHERDVMDSGSLHLSDVLRDERAAHALTSAALAYRDQYPA